MLSKIYRPKRFVDLIGQESNVILLKEILKRGVATPLIFTGAFGSGKTSASRVFAKAVLCKERIEQEPCCACASCLDFEKDQNINYQEIDAASNGDVESIRQLRDQVGYQAVGSKFKVTNIDEAHNITKQGYNALLKILEEDVAHHIFIFCTNEPEKMLATVRSRCWRIHCKPSSRLQIKQHLTKIAEEMSILVDDEALTLIANTTAPHIRDALNALEFLSFNGKITDKDVEAYFHLSDDLDVIGVIEALDNPAEVLVTLDRLLSRMDVSTVFDKIILMLLDLESLRIKAKSYDFFIYPEEMKRAVDTNKDFLSLSRLMLQIERPIDANYLKHLLLEGYRLVAGVPVLEQSVTPRLTPVAEVEQHPFSETEHTSPKLGFRYDAEDVTPKHESNIDLNNQENYKFLRKRKDNIPTVKVKTTKLSDPMSEPISFDTAAQYLLKGKR